MSALLCLLAIMHTIFDRTATGWCALLCNISGVCITAEATTRLCVVKVDAGPALIDGTSIFSDFVHCIIRSYFDASNHTAVDQQLTLCRSGAKSVCTTF